MTNLIYTNKAILSIYKAYKVATMYKNVLIKQGFKSLLIVINNK
jgi:hypothetical protein